MSKNLYYRSGFLSALFVFSFFSPCFPDTVSTTGVQFLKIPVGVRGAGMGGVFNGVADDVSTVYWNTAGLAQIQDPEINLLHLSYFLGVNYEFVGFAVPFKNGGALGLSASFDAVPSFNSTSSPSAVPGSASDLAVAVGYGQSFGDNLAVGLGGKIISSSLVTNQALGGGLDAGILLYTKAKDWTFGLSLQNFGVINSFASGGTQEKLPWSARAGLAYRFQPENPTHFLIGLDVERPSDNDPVVHLGGEGWMGVKGFAAAFRAGYTVNTSNADLGGLAGASAGGGIRISNLEVDYAIVPFGILGETHRFSLTYRFGPEGPPPEKVTAKMLALQIHPEGADLKTGTLQQATFNLANKIEAHTDIKNWVFEIKDPKTGAVIRTYSGKGIPPAQLSWDGKDANGNLVPGGLFANANLRTVDSHGLEVSSSEPIFKISEAATQKGPAFTAPILPRNLVPTGYWGTLQLPDVFFSPGSPAIRSDYFNYLDQVIQLIRKYPNARVYVEGHAYEEGDERAALRLSQDRADAVLRYLVEKGQISPHNLYARGHGSSAPLESGGSEEFKFKNRRVTIVIFTK